MAFKMVNGAAVMNVNTTEQRDSLIAKGWTCESGSAGDAYNVHDYSNPTPLDFKGVGLEGEVPGTIGYVAKKATEGATPAQYEALVDMARNYGGHKPDDTYTDIVTVSAFPASPVATTVYLLSEKDATTGTAPGVYVYKDNAWTAYTI